MLTQFLMKIWAFLIPSFNLNKQMIIKICICQNLISGNNWNNFGRGFTNGGVGMRFDRNFAPVETDKRKWRKRRKRQNGRLQPIYLY